MGLISSFALSCSLDNSLDVWQTQHHVMSEVTCYALTLPSFKPTTLKEKSKKTCGDGYFKVQRLLRKFLQLFLDSTSIEHAFKTKPGGILTNQGLGFNKGIWRVSLSIQGNANSLMCA